jgi:membrane-bound serine protease (ClpP class)
MRRWLVLPVALLVFVLCWGHPTAYGETAVVNVIELDNQIITPVVQKYIETAIDRSESDGAVCLVIILDTPGGLMESARAIVKRLMNAQVPIVVYVAPSGSRAASAGLFITLAAHVAAMAPSTNIGAAHPVALGGMGESIEKTVKRMDRSDSEKGKGKGGESKEEVVREEQRSTMDEKIINDTVAWITTIARARGRNEKWAEKAVTESVSITEEEAVKEHVVDFIALDLPDLFSKLNGRQIQIKGKTVTLTTAGAATVTIPMTPWQKFLAVIAHPNIAYLLMMLGILGLIFEFTHPGVAFPGIAGAICLLLALYAFQILPVSYAAIALLILGLVLLVAEVKVVSHGLLALGGAVCLTLGSLLLFQSPDPALRVSLSVILSMVITLVAITLIVLQRAVRSLSYPIVTGAEGLIGEIGEASTDLDLGGTVFVHGENWKASSSLPIKRGEKVRVVRVKGLSLEVEPQRPEHKEKGEV